MKNPILESLEYKAEDGALSFRGVRYMIMRPETLMEMYRAMEHEAQNACRDSFFAGGRAGGKLSAERYRGAGNLSPEETAAYMAKMGGEIGWGCFSIRRLDLEARVLEVEVRSSPFAAAYGQSPQPVCHMIRGVLTGLGEVIFQGEVRGEEKECRACGAACCRFVIKG